MFAVYDGWGVKRVGGWVDGTDMFLVHKQADIDLAIDLARRYRVAVDVDAEAGLLVRCVEWPEVVCNGRTVEAALACVRDRVSRAALMAVSRGQSLPVPRSEAEEPLGSWAADLDLSAEPAAPIPTPADGWVKPEGEALARMAQAEAGRYRIWLEWSEGGFVASVAEMPEVVARGEEAGRAVEAARSGAAVRLAEMLERNVLPPEPLRERERRGQRRAERPELRVA